MCHRTFNGVRTLNTQIIIIIIGIVIIIIVIVIVMCYVLSLSLSSLLLQIDVVQIDRCNVTDVFSYVFQEAAMAKLAASEAATYISHQVNTKFLNMRIETPGNCAFNIQSSIWIQDKANVLLLFYLCIYLSMILATIINVFSHNPTMCE